MLEQAIEIGFFVVAIVGEISWITIAAFKTLKKDRIQ